ncbi:MAG: hypothetical protein SFX18_00505 [Pirellulales bacterium]|nr:hypothetical protein [Pirellulales bacterium]
MERESVLVSILAISDAIFYPCREPLENGPLIYGARKTFVKKGIPWSSTLIGARNNAQQVEIHRLVGSLIHEGLIKCHGRENKKLTDQGDSYARRLVGIPTIAESIGLLELLAEYSKSAKGYEHFNARWQPETWLAFQEFDTPGFSEQARGIEMRLLPALNRNWVDSNCSTLGHCWYRLKECRPDMWALSSKQADFAKEVQINPAMQKLYRELRTFLPKAEKILMDIGLIPIPISTGITGIPTL